MMLVLAYYVITFFFFNDTATTEIYTLSLHDALPICLVSGAADECAATVRRNRPPRASAAEMVQYLAAVDRKSTRLNSSHTVISYAVFCLKKKIIGIDACGRASTFSVLLQEARPQPND